MAVNLIAVNSTTVDTDGNPKILGNSFIDCQFVSGTSIPSVLLKLDYPVTLSEITSLHYEKNNPDGLTIGPIHREINQRLMDQFNTQVLIINSEKMKITSCHLNMNTGYDSYELNPDGGYFLDFIRFFVNRGYLSTPLTSQSSIATQSYPYIKSNSIGITIPNTADLAGSIYSASLNNPDFSVISFIKDSKLVFDTKQRLHSPLTLDDYNDYIDNPLNRPTIRNKYLLSLRSQFNGQVMYVDDEQMLITDVSDITIGLNIENPDGGYFIETITFIVNRGYNGTTIAAHATSYDPSHPITPWFSNTYVNSNDEYIIINENVSQSLIINNNNYNLMDMKESILGTLEVNNTILDFVDFMQKIEQIISIENSYYDLGDLLLLVNQGIKISNTEEHYVIITEMVNQLIKHTGILDIQTSANILITVNELIKVSGNFNNSVEFNDFIIQTLSILNNAYHFGDNEFLIVVNQLLKISNTVNVTYETLKVLLVYVNELISIYGNIYNYAEYSEKIKELIAIKNTSKDNMDYLVAFNQKIAIDNYSMANLEFYVFVKELLKTQFFLQLGSKRYEAYCVELENGALTTYENYPFNSFAKFNNEYYALSNDGLAILGGHNDNGEDLKALVRTGYFNVANIQTKSNSLSSIRDTQKRLNGALLIVKNDNSFIFRIYDDNGKAFDYTTNEVYDNEQFRVSIGKNIKSTLFKFELVTTGEFELKDCEVIPIILNRSI